MLLKIGIDPDAAQELIENGIGPGRLLIRFLKERSLLVTDSDQSAAELLVEFAQTGSPELAEVIFQLVQNRRTPTPSPQPVPLKDVSGESDLRSWATAAHLLLLAQYRLDVVGKAGTRPELSTFATATNSDAVADLLEKWHGFIPKGTNRESIWNQRFAPLAAQTRSVYILDHYAAANFADELRGAPGSSIKGPAWFLGHLARTKVKRIHLACSSQPIEQKNMTVAQASELLTRWMRDRNPRIELRLHFERYFDHGRRVAFDGWAGFGIHNGLATFDHPELTEMLELHADAPLAQAVAAEVLRISPFMT